MEDKGKKNISVELKDKKNELFDQGDKFKNDQIKENHQKEQEIESIFPIINNVQRRQFQYSKYRTEILTCNNDNLKLKKVLNSMPLYKQEKIYELKKKVQKTLLISNSKKLEQNHYYKQS
ncbi:unnamed protein product [Paramecium primaurelia]|uniref:Uncharacterized protein n=1 Tax=Paramecium primaurelia TaxID=5886 RepID=A0A8S1JT64_PARPR|nr:unnamed protein product [Paramecium primaurelia]